MVKHNEIPTVDLQPLQDGSRTGTENVAEQLKERFASVGFAYLVNHQVPESLIDSVFKEAMRFHDLPLEAKLKIKHNDAYRGYMPYKSSQTKVSTEGTATKPNLVDSFVMMFEVDETHPDYQERLYLAGPNQWPENLPGFKEVVCQYRDTMLKLSYQLIKAFSVALGMEPNALDHLFADPTYFLRLQHYPAPEGTISKDQFGIAAHTDAGFVTMLSQDTIGGLEVRLGDGRWVGVPYVPNTFVLNAGAMLQRLSNDIFRAVPHRVINQSNKTRYSVPFFFDTNTHAMIEVLKSCVTSEHPAKYSPIMYGEYLLDRIQGNYGVGKRNKDTAYIIKPVKNH